MQNTANHRPRIVVGVDGSRPADAALAWAIGMARTMNAEIVAVHAIDTPFLAYYGYAGVPPVQYDPAWRAQIAREFTEDWCAPLKHAGLRYRTVLEEGRAASVIAAVADRYDADLVVTGRHGRGGVAEFVLGSTSHELSLHCKRPVVLIHQPWSKIEPTPEPALAGGTI
ncbi:MAG TPA: universal stress protein [Candidatus Limnocylindrales bacterium]|nr:universal stress protein [Candidatus Limnocylindrales bacterium]